MFEADHVAMDFLIPGEDLRIIIQGNPREFASAVMEIRTQDGRLIKRFEEEQLPVKQLEPAEP